MKKAQNQPGEFLNILSQMRNSMIQKKDVWSIDDLIAYTGYEKSYIYKLTSQRLIPHYKCLGGKTLFFKREEILGWLTAIPCPMLKIGNFQNDFKSGGLTKKLNQF